MNEVSRRVKYISGSTRSIKNKKNPGNTTAIYLQYCFISLLLTEQLILLSNVSVRTQNDQEQVPCNTSVPTYL